MLQSLLLPIALSILPTTLALHWPGPRATPTPSLPDAQGWTPKPTSGPQFHVKGNPKLDLKFFRRQGQTKYPNTCGYVDGNAEYSITCEANYACAYASLKFAFGCCSGTSSSSNGNVYFTEKCFVDTSTTGCFGSTEADLCTGLCTISAQVCSQSSAPVCRQVLQFGTDAIDPTTYTLWDCVPLGGNTKVSLQYYYSVSSTLTPNPLIDPSYTFDGTTFVLIGATATTSSNTKTSGGGGPTAEPFVGKPKKKSTGAIAGGVVGGLAAVGLIAGAVIWALMKKKEKARSEASAVNEVSHVTYMHDTK